MNKAINGFVKGAAIEQENGVRINAIGPGRVEPGYPGLYQKRPGGQTGQIYKVLYQAHKIRKKIKMVCVQ